MIDPQPQTAGATAETKYRQLLELIRSYRRVIVALSGGLDSSFLLYACVQALGTGSTSAAIGVSDALPAVERDSARNFAFALGLPESSVILIQTREIDDPNYASNPANRCFYCKSELYDRLSELAARRHQEVICDGANASDIGDHRPGMVAARERSVRSPLLAVGLTKDEIRALSQAAGLSIWDKPQSACLASRIPYGSPVTPEKLKQIEAAEDYLKSLGFRQLRVRHHGQVARIELAVEDMMRLIVDGRREEVTRKFREIGFLFTTLDLTGFSSGSMNLMLKGNTDESGNSA